MDQWFISVLRGYISVMANLKLVIFSKRSKVLLNVIAELL